MPARRPPLCRLLHAFLPALLGVVAALSACSPVRVLNALASSDGYTAVRDLAYGEDPRQRLDVYQPRDAARAPVVVFFYGGTWKSGSRTDYAFLGAALASEGVVVAIADYRLHPQVRYPHFLEDAARAVAWVRREAPRFGGDPQRLYVMGHSAGAYNAAMLALDPRWLAAEGLAPAQLAGWIGLAGPYDFLPSADPDVQPVFHHPAYPRGAQPIEHVSDAAPRTFLGAARSDSVVDLDRNTLALAAQLRAAGVPVTLELYARVSHITLVGAFAWPLRHLAPVLKDVRKFVR